MQRVRTAALAALMLGLGYWLGISGLGPGRLTADDKKAPAEDLGIADATIGKIRDANQRLTDAKEALEAEGKYEPITEGLNSFLILTGGGSAKTDLEAGRGVDPETFAALYAGKALPEIQPLLGSDEQGRVTYNNEVVRMYSKSRLQKALERGVRIKEHGP